MVGTKICGDTWKARLLWAQSLKRTLACMMLAGGSPPLSPPGRLMQGPLRCPGWRQAATPPLPPPRPAPPEKAPSRNESARLLPCVRPPRFLCSQLLLPQRREAESGAAALREPLSPAPPPPTRGYFKAPRDGPGFPVVASHEQQASESPAAAAPRQPEPGAAACAVCVNGGGAAENPAWNSRSRLRRA